MSEPFRTQITLAPYACHPAHSRGRLHVEAESPTRSCYQRDRDRIIHCAAFRRLEYKTQVFVNHEGDHYRTRLTHSLEVSQLARSIARELGLNEDLSETLALAHDLGHTPFGHAGEDALKETMADFGGFDHNAHCIRILTHLEHRYAAFDGLNLTWETLEGIAKHNGPVTHPPRALAEYAAIHDLELGSYASAEAQVASLADDIAYNNHDLDDGLRAGMFTLDEVADVPLVGNVLAEVRAAYPGVPASRIIHEMVRRLIHRMASDLAEETRRHIREARITSPDDVRRLGRPLVCFSEAMQSHNRAIKAFLMARMYRHWRVNRMSSKARRILKDLFALLLAEPSCLPPEWHPLIGPPGSRETALAVADYLAGMTDRYAIDEHRKLFDAATRA